MSSKAPNSAHHFAVSVSHSVAEPEATAEWLAAELDFWLEGRRGEAIVVENGALSLCLMAADTKDSPALPLRLEVVCRDLQTSIGQLTSAPGVSCVGEVRQASEQRFEQLLTTPFGIDLLLVRLVDEDEHGIIPPLDKKLLWQPEAEVLVQQTLRHVPLAFRPGARAKATGRAEYLAVGEGLIEVHSQLAVRAMIETTPAFKYDDLRRSLLEQGVDLQTYAQFFLDP